MNGQLKVEATVHFGRGTRSERILWEGSPPESPRGRVPRITRLMALAIRFDELIRTGRVKNQLQLAKFGGVTRQRVTQIMNLLLLAPDIQEALLTLPRLERGREAVNLKGMQTVARDTNWHLQRKIVAKILAPSREQLTHQWVELAPNSTSLTFHG